MMEDNRLNIGKNIAETNSGIEFYLGPFWLGGYEIIERPFHKPFGEGACLLTVQQSRISDGDGVGATFDESFIKIDESDYNHIVELYHKYGNEMDDVAEKGISLNREIQDRDYLYCGGYYMHIIKLANPLGFSKVRCFCYDFYNLDINQETEDFEDLFSTDELDEWLPDFILINEQIYNEALNLGKSRISELFAYVKDLYENRVKQQITDNR